MIHPKVDPYAKHARACGGGAPRGGDRGRSFFAVPGAEPAVGESSGVAVEAEAEWLDVLVRVRSGDWKAPLEGVRVLARMGAIVAARVARGRVDELARDPGVLGLEVSREGGTEEGAIEELVMSVDVASATRVRRPPGEERGDRCLLAVIDSGIDVLHAAFGDGAGGTRLEYVWDLRGAYGRSPKEVDPGFGWSEGTLHDRADVERYLAAGVVPRELGRDPRGHGTHVASLAAGRAFGAVDEGMAPDAPLVVVIAPVVASPGAPVSLGYSSAHVMALQFIEQVAQKLGLPVVVNLSAGMNAGAHDGSSSLEAAFDDFTSGGRAPGRAVVKSAGNERTRRGHARVVPQKGIDVPVTWSSLPVERAEDYLEAWFPEGCELGFVLESPGGDRSEEVSAERPAVEATLGTTRCMVDLRRFHVDNGEHCLQVVLRPAGDGAAIEEGEWTLHCVARRVTPGAAVDLWIERFGARAYLEFLQEASTEGTLTVPGTARSVICVGAVAERSGVVRSLRESCGGPTRDGRAKPDLVARGERVLGALAGAAEPEGARDGATALTGTSTAAPQVAGLLALLQSGLHKAQRPLLGAHQARAILVSHCRDFTGSWTPTLGFGLLDAGEVWEALFP